MIAVIEAIRRVVTMYGIGRIAMTSRASISSEIRMAPSWAVNRQPLWVANASAAAIGASSRVLTSEEMMPTAGPRPSSWRKL